MKKGFYRQLFLKYNSAFSQYQGIIMIHSEIFTTHQPVENSLAKPSENVYKPRILIHHID